MDEQQKEEDLWGWGMEREKAMDAQYILIVYYNYYIYLYIYINHKVSIKLWLNLKSAKKHLSFFFFFFYTFVFLIFFYIWTLQGCLFFFFSFLPILKSALLFKLLLDRTSASWRIQHFFSWLLWNERITTMTITNNPKKRQQVERTERRLPRHSLPRRRSKVHHAFERPRRVKPSSTKTCCSHGRTRRHLLTLFTFIKGAESFSAISHFTHLTLT